ncbi:MAG: hypothetical protein QXT77_05695 [Candidatus Methanomethylicaceae archaeon]
MKNISENDLRSYGWMPYEEPERVIDKEKEKVEKKAEKVEPVKEVKPEPVTETESNDFEIPEIKEETKPAAKKPGRKPKTKTAKK